MKATTYVWMLAGGLALAGCGPANPKPSKRVQKIHAATASVVAKHVNSQVPEGGVVLLVHRQAAKAFAESWEEGLNDSLDERFTLMVYGYDQLSEEAATSLQAEVPLAEGMQSQNDAVAVISAIQVSPRKFAALAKDGPAMFALEWPFFHSAAPLLRAKLLKAGVFEKERRDASAKAEPGASPEEIIAPRYFVATPDNWKEFDGK